MDRQNFQKFYNLSRMFIDRVNNNFDKNKNQNIRIYIINLTLKTFYILYKYKKSN